MNPCRGVFVTGTDTEVGKTFVSVALLHALNETGMRTAAMKPIATGCEQHEEGLRNSDALQLQAAASVPCPYDLVNPYAFAPPIAPQVAAARARISIEINLIADTAARLASRCDFLLVEGVGGWRVPLNEAATVGDLSRRLGLAAILVVGLRLGSINHTLLSIEAMRADQVAFLGWVANLIDPCYDTVPETIATLTQRIGSPPLATFPWQAQSDARLAAPFFHCLAAKIRAQHRAKSELP